jgi:hypothetical protein
MSLKKEKRFGELVTQRLAKYESLTSARRTLNTTLPPCHAYKRSWSYDEKELSSRKMHITTCCDVKRREPVDNLKREREPEYVRHVFIIIKLEREPEYEEPEYVKHVFIIIKLERESEYARHVFIIIKLEREPEYEEPEYVKHVQ